MFEKSNENPYRATGIPAHREEQEPRYELLRSRTPFWFCVVGTGLWLVSLWLPAVLFGDLGSLYGLGIAIMAWWSWPSTLVLAFSPWIVKSDRRGTLTTCAILLTITLLLAGLFGLLDMKNLLIGYFVWITSVAACAGGLWLRVSELSHHEEA